MKTVKIYTLSSTRNSNDIRYVGKTVSKLCKRKAGHKSDAKKHLDNNHTYNWYRQEVKDGYDILMEQIEEIPLENYTKNETYWIAQFKEWGFNLTNDKEGDENDYLPGKTINFSKEVRQNIGKRASEVHGSRIRSKNDEVKYKTSLRMTGKIQSQETINKRKETILRNNNGVWPSRIAKPVSLLENGIKIEDFDTIVDCSTFLGLSPTYITKIINRDFPLYGKYNIVTIQ